MRRLIALVLLALWTAGGPACAEAGRRVALVIGNGNYSNVARLINPPADAAGVVKALREVGFDVVQGVDLPRSELVDRIRAFAQKSEEAEVALVYYAGHGLQVDNENWLLPIDAKIKDKFSLEFEAISLSSVVRATASASSRILILDACRNNPFADQIGANGRAVVGRGLARVNVSDNGVLIAFATSPGNIALDSAGGTESNSPFAKALIDNIHTPGLEVRQMFTRVRQSVFSATNGAQIPWENSSLLNDVFLAGLPDKQISPLEAEYAEWQKLENATDVKTIEEFLKRYPSGKFAPLAQFRINSLLRPVTTPPEQNAAARDCSACPEMVAVPAGAFLMGAAADDPEKSENEAAAGRVEVAAFAMGRFAVTFAEWDACVAAGGCKTKPDDAGWGRDRRPVINVSFDDASQYVAWLSRKSGKKYRLPSEAEWEYAARAGSESARPWKNAAAEACAYANVYDSTAAKGVPFKWKAHECADGFVFTAPVGSFQPNAFGLFDMIGNVWQWTGDCWRDKQDAPAQVASLRGAPCALRALRGGSWMSDPANARAPTRMRNDASDRDINIGFRVARDAD